jgi:hypothetical protein
MKGLDSAALMAVGPPFSHPNRLGSIDWRYRTSKVRFFLLSAREMLEVPQESNHQHDNGEKYEKIDSQIREESSKGCS